MEFRVALFLTCVGTALGFAPGPSLSPKVLSHTIGVRSARAHRSQPLYMGLFDKIPNPLKDVKLSDPFEEATVLGKGVTVVKLQVALDTPDRGPKSILRLLEAKANAANTDTAWGLACLMSDVSMELLRKSDDWVAACSQTTAYQGRDAPDKAETAFNRMLTTELSKFEKEYVPELGEPSAGPETLVVVSLLCAIRGDRTDFGDVSGEASLAREALQSLAADVKVERGELVLAAEVLWTPSEADEVLTKRDMLLDYPELMEI